MLKGVLFDIDGVITDTAEFHNLAWTKLGDVIGI
ncbi:beta-phosphoglucomutase, partial [Enterococcus faecium]